MKKKRDLLILFGIPLLILLGIAFQPISTLTFGKEITLRATPMNEQPHEEYEPFLVQFEIEKVPIQLLSDQLQLALTNDLPLEGRKVFGKLANEQSITRLTELTDQKPANVLYLAGRIEYVEKNSEGEFVLVDFGLANLYIPTEQQAEPQSKDDTLLAHVKVQNGYGYLKTLVME